MRAELKKRFKRANCLIMAAAVSYFRPKRKVQHKIKKDSSAPTAIMRKDTRLFLELEKNPDILGELSKQKGDRLLIGFAMETGHLAQNMRTKLKKKHLDIIVGNQIGKNNFPFGEGKGKFLVADQSGFSEEIKEISKEQLAKILLDKIEKLWYNSQYCA
jgi:phosphopantothenoylcysteine decarboxylase/phosphopantothenate--cysteine ligase